MANELLDHWLGIHPADWNIGKPPRYGENPHQDVAIYYRPGITGPLGGILRQDGADKPMSYNNFLDADRASKAAYAHGSVPVVAIVKHGWICGLAAGDNLLEAYERANALDTESAFGGIAGCNGTVDKTLAEAMTQEDRFLEVLVARKILPEAMEVFAKKKKRRIIELPDILWEPQYRSIPGGMLIQEPDRGDPAGTEWKVVSKVHPTPEDRLQLEFLWRTLPYVGSNSIVIGNNYETTGVGTGQQKRIRSVKLAIEMAGNRTKGGFLVSDAFFPFRDSVDLAGKVGIKAIAHTGGSVKDADSIAAADEHGIAMFITSVRHFTH